MHIHDGRMYEVSYKTPDGSPLADDSSFDFLFRPGSVHCHFSFGPIAANPLEVSFYEGSTIANVGTSLNVVGMNRDRSLPPAGTGYRSPDVSAVGNLLNNTLHVWGLSPLTPGFPTPLWILAKNTDYLIRLINRSGSAQDVGIVIQWFEEAI
jgi:hypothetical protein